MAEITANRVAHNTLYLTVAYVAQKVFSFAFFIFAARLLEVGEIGQYVFALSFTTIFGIFIDMGLSPVLTREAAKDTATTPAYLNAIINFKLLASVVVYVIAVATAHWLGKPPLVQQLIAISGLIMIFDSFSLTLYAAFRARQNLVYEAVGMVVGQVIIFICGITALFTGQSLHFIMGSIMMGSLFNALYAAYLARRKLAWHWQARWNAPMLKMLLVMALPFAVAGLFSRVYGYLDTVLLSLLAGDQAVGWYAASYKITFALQFIPLAFAAALYPAMSQGFAGDKESVARLFEKSMYYLLAIALPISIGAIVLAKPLLLTMYGPAYAATFVALQILMASLVFNFLSFPSGSLLNAGNKQLTNTVNMGITMVMNAVANIILIPLFAPQGYVGAAIAALLGSLWLFGLGLWRSGQIIVYRRRWLLAVSSRLMIAVGLMALVIWWVSAVWPLWLVVLTGAVVYVVGLMLTRAVDWPEVKTFTQSLLRRS